jgi:hypothetical protein
MKGRQSQCCVARERLSQVLERWLGFAKVRVIAGDLVPPQPVLRTN